MCGSSKHTGQMTMIAHSILTEFVVTDVTKSGVIINQFIMHGHYHAFWELKLFINVFDILFKCVYKYLRNIIIVMFFCTQKWFLRIECILKTLYVVTKSAGDVFLIQFSVDLVRGWLTCWQLWCEGFKIIIYNKWDSPWSIMILKRYFRSLFGKFNFNSFVWFTILMMRC